VDLNDTLKQFEAVEANRAKLERLWDRIKALLPTGNQIGVSNEDEYRSLQRSFIHIAKGMPKIDGFALEEYLLNSDAVAVFHGDRERQLRLSRFAPFVESVGRNQAAPFGEGLPE
jgi:hypothetical protein